MIINNIRAENVLKYAHLELNHLPTEGLIAISGRNESGKSTVGEIICFALFGRTFSLRPEELVKVIHWGETRCLVMLDFTAGEGSDYRVERSLDDAGNQGATLTRMGQEEPQARGPEAVTAEIARLAGFGYNEFIESFYLAQREIVAPHGHSAAVKAMAGLTPLEHVHAQLGEEIKTLTDDIINAERDITDMNDRLGALKIQPDYLSSLWTDLSAAKTEHGEKFTRARLLRHASDHCRDSLEMLKERTGPIVKAGVNTSYQEWVSHAENLDACAQNIDQQCTQRDYGSAAAESTAKLKDFARHMKSQLDRLGEIKERAQSYRTRLAGQLGESGTNDVRADRRDGQAESLPAKKADLNRGIEAAKRSRKTVRVCAVIFLILAAVAWALWVLLYRMPNAAAPVVQWFNTNMPGWHSYNAPLLWAAVALSILFILFLIRGMMLSARINANHNESAVLDQRIGAARKEATALDNLETMPLPEAVAVLKNVKDEQIAAQASKFENDSSTTFLEHDAVNEYHRQLILTIARSENELEAMRDRMATEVTELDRDVQKSDGTITQLQHAIPVEQERRRKADHLRGLMQSLQTKIDDDRHKIEVRNLGRDLLDEGSQHISRRFNHDVRNLVGRTLPVLTADRYEHLQIDEALRVRVYSGDKHGFLNMDEISSGTQRQVMLAVRLALAQKLINTAVDGKQFIFLDEPFAFFDQQRTRDSLSVLPQLSDDITQTWVIAQEFPEDVHCDLHIRCEHNVTDMEVGAT
jgi:DNA repair exonuclease SbcCD ATPase subunit